MRRTHVTLVLTVLAVAGCAGPASGPSPSAPPRLAAMSGKSGEDQEFTVSTVSSASYHVRGLQAVPEVGGRGGNTVDVFTCDPGDGSILPQAIASLSSLVVDRSSADGTVLLRTVDGHELRLRVRGVASWTGELITGGIVEVPAEDLVSIRRRLRVE